MRVHVRGYFLASRRYRTEIQNTAGYLDFLPGVCFGINNLSPPPGAKQSNQQLLMFGGQGMLTTGKVRGRGVQSRQIYQYL